MTFLKKSSVLMLSLLICASPLAAEQQRGQETNLPIPRYVSLKADQANVRRGPSLTQSYLNVLMLL